MANVRIVVNQKAVAELLKGAEVQRDLERRGRAIAEAAGPGHEVQTFTGRSRVRITVRTATFSARYAEATRRTLSKAIDAGR